MTPLPVTMVAAALLGLIGVILSARVIQLRGASGVSLLGGGASSYAAGEESTAPPLVIAQRTHANFFEYAPFGLILIGLTETAGAPRLVCVGLAALLVIGRALHPFGMPRRIPNPYRAGGMILTLASIILASAYLLYAAL